MENLRHVQLPNDLIKVIGIKPKDLLIYLTIKSFENKETHEAYPTKETVATICRCDVKTVASSISRLVESEFISVRKVSRANVYTFKPYDNFECFSHEFIYMDMKFQVKAYLVAMQQYMIKKHGVGTSTFSIEEISDKLHTPIRSINRYERELMDDGFMTKLQTRFIDPETGCIKKERIYELLKFFQAIVFKIKEHEKRIQKLEENQEEKTEEENKDSFMLREPDVDYAVAKNKEIARLIKMNEDKDFKIKELQDKLRFYEMTEDKKNTGKSDLILD